ncbi:MAG TPA: 2-oxo acid dehydrogenase subunit E2, partial [Nannocystaceae bacterium]|nr:2-oxo acid dehydrogenase subunit E2 [Nannocystaceae bacterium]
GVMRLLSFLNYTLNLDLRWAGIPRDPFGGAMVTNIGSLGLEGAYVPLVPFSRVPIVIALGAVEDAPCVREGALAIEKIMRVFATFDHRIVDGAHAAKMVKIVRAWFERPFEHFGTPQ